MKLRTRLTIFCVLLCAAAVAVCAALIVAFTWEQSISTAADAALADMRSFRAAFSDADYRSGISSDAALVRRSYVTHIFRSLPSSYEYTLAQGGEYLSNNAGFAPEKLLERGASADTGARWRSVSVLGTDYMLAGDTITVGGGEYSLCLVRDISALTADVRALAGTCIAVSAAVIAAAALAMSFIVRRALRPVETLRASAAALAQGSYEKRIKITGRDELAGLAADFNSMAAAIEANISELGERSARQQAFINDMAHEMKTPVTSIMLNAETLLNRKVPAEASERALSRIYDQAGWLERLSGRLMTLVMLHGGAELRSGSVPALLESVRDAAEDALREAGMALTVECDMGELPMDADLMRSALVNLVENARRASAHGQTITLRAYDNVIEVVDHGRGIPAAELARITEPFYMVDRSRSKKNGGSGLGLALVQTIAAAHGAELIIESAEGEGTAARIVFAK